MFVNLNKNATWYVKLGSAFGPPRRPFNGLGQGDPLVSLAAILYVSYQCNVVKARVPGVKMSAVIDDRGVREESQRKLTNQSKSLWSSIKKRVRTRMQIKWR